MTIREDVHFKNKTNGLDAVELPYNAMPEIDLADVSTKTTFLGTELQMPLLVTGMTGGYEGALSINHGLADVCAEAGVAMGVGSMRAALENEDVHESYSIVKQYSDRIPIVGNIGAVQLVRAHSAGNMKATCDFLVELIGAKGLAVHLNPLQELMQPEGEPHYKGVLDAIAEAVEVCPVPIIVKEVGAGISGSVATKLAAVGVQHIDVAGAGGTSWAGVEIMRHEDSSTLEQFWDVGIPTAECIRQCRGTVPTLIASGGISDGTQMAKAIALGANMVGSARPILKVYANGGTHAVSTLLAQWKEDLRRWMFLTGSQTLHRLANVI